MAQAEEEPKLIFAYHVARHGPSNGNRDTPDILNDGKIDGELTNTGRQWSYGAGRRLALEYKNPTRPFLQSLYSDEDIEIRTQGNNRSTESAMAFMYGLYPPETNTRLMWDNQTSFAVPQIKISEDILSEV